MKYENYSLLTSDCAVCRRLSAERLSPWKETRAITFVTSVTSVTFVTFVTSVTFVPLEIVDDDDGFVIVGDVDDDDGDHADDEGGCVSDHLLTLT